LQTGRTETGEGDKNWGRQQNYLKAEGTTVKEDARSKKGAAWRGPTGKKVRPDGTVKGGRPTLEKRRTWAWQKKKNTKKDPFGIQRATPGGGKEHLMEANRRNNARSKGATRGENKI